MSTNVDLDRALRDYLADGPVRLPEGAYAAVSQRLPRTRQRAVIGPWREPSMLRIFAVLAAALLVVALAVVGFGALNQSTPTTPTATPSPSDTALTYRWPGPLAAGTYTTSMIWDTPFAFTFTLPDGWDARDVEVIKDPVSRVNEVGGPEGMSVEFSLIDAVYADPCTRGVPDEATGRRSRTLPRPSPPCPVHTRPRPWTSTFAGFSGKYLELSIGSDAGCAPADYALWRVRSEWYRLAEHEGPLTFTAERERYRIWILDVNDWTVLVAALAATDATEAGLAEQQAILDSIQIGPPVEETVTGPCTVEFVSPSAPGAPLDQGPLSASMVAGLAGVRGPRPDPYPIVPPAAQLDFTGAGPGWGSRPGVTIIPPAGSARQGFATAIDRRRSPGLIRLRRTRHLVDPDRR